MSTILTARYHRDESPPVATQRKGMRSETSPFRIWTPFATAKDEPAKPIMSQNFDESVNNPIRTVNDIKINRHYQSSTQVR
jgi:hypothetical protein